MREENEIRTVVIAVYDYTVRDFEKKVIEQRSIFLTGEWHRALVRLFFFFYSIWFSFFFEKILFIAKMASEEIELKYT